MTAPEARCLCTISSLLMRWVVFITRSINLFVLLLHEFRASRGSCNIIVKLTQQKLGMWFRYIKVTFEMGQITK